MYGMGGFGGGMGGYGGGNNGNPQFQNAVGQHLGNMMGGQAAQGMGNQFGYNTGPQMAASNQPAMNYGQIGQGVSNQFEYNAGMKFAPHTMPMVTNFPGYGGGYGNMGQQISGHMPGYGSMGQQISGQFPVGDPSKYFNGGSWNIAPNNDWAYGRQTMDAWHSRPTYGGAPTPDTGRVDNPYGSAPQPDTGRVDNPDMQRQYANGDQFHNRKGNLRMRYRDMQPSYQ